MGGKKEIRQRLRISAAAHAAVASQCGPAVRRFAAARAVIHVGAAGAGDLSARIDIRHGRERNG
jgi:hypothetical protein